MTARKSIEAHKRDGTWRKDRHGNNEPGSIGTLTKPPTLDDPEANWFWDNHIEQVIANGAGGGDLAMFISACNWWAVYKRVEQKTKADDSYRPFCMMSMAWKNFNTAASRLGLSPTERAKLRDLPRPSTEENELERYIASK
jgi:phage terminase small subunit